MLRTFVSHLMVVTLLIMSLEGAIGSVFAAQSPHVDGIDQLLEHSDQNQNSAGHSTPDQTGEQSNDHCEHCCHGHTSCLSACATTLAHFHPSALILYSQSQFQYFALAPPTPPPTA